MCRWLTCRRLQAPTQRAGGSCALHRAPRVRHQPPPRRPCRAGAQCSWALTPPPHHRSTTPLPPPRHPPRKLPPHLPAMPMAPSTAMGSGAPCSLPGPALHLRGPQQATSLPLPEMLLGCAPMQPLAHRPARRGACAFIQPLVHRPLQGETHRMDPALHLRRPQQTTCLPQLEVPPGCAPMQPLVHRLLKGQTCRLGPAFHLRRAGRRMGTPQPETRRGCAPMRPPLHPPLQGETCPAWSLPSPAQCWRPAQQGPSGVRSG